MSDYLAYLTAQRAVQDLATSALPGAPVCPVAAATPGRGRLRRRAAQVLVRTAERLEPGAAGTHLRLRVVK
jgi:hypothetical protein